MSVSIIGFYGRSSTLRRATIRLVKNLFGFNYFTRPVLEGLIVSTVHDLTINPLQWKQNCGHHFDTGTMYDKLCFCDN